MKTILKYSLLTAFAISILNCSNDSTDDANVTKATVKLTDLQKDNLKGKVEKIEEKEAETTTTTSYNEAGFLLRDKFERTNYLSDKTITYNPDNFILVDKMIEKSGSSAATESSTTFEYDEKNILKVSTIKNVAFSVVLNYTFDDAKKTLTGTNGKTGNDKIEQVIKYNDKLNVSETLTTFYPGGNKTVTTTKQDANGLEIEEDQARNTTKTEYNDNFQKIKKTYTDKGDATKNNTTTYLYSSPDNHLAKETIAGLIASTTTYEYVLDAQKNWTKRTKTSQSGNNQSIAITTTRVITYYK